MRLRQAWREMEAVSGWMRSLRGYSEVDLEVMGDHLTEHQRRVVQEAQEHSLLHR